MVKWLREKDTYTRGMMVTLMKNSGYSQGEALTMALAKSEIVWSSGRSLGGSKRERSPSPDKNKARRQSQQSSVSASARVKYAQMAKGGRKFCIAWNRGKCVKDGKCPEKFLHACNVVENGKTCNSTNHRACKHWY